MFCVFGLHTTFSSFSQFSLSLFFPSSYLHNCIASCTIARLHIARHLCASRQSRLSRLSLCHFPSWHTFVTSSSPRHPSIFQPTSRFFDDSSNRPTVQRNISTLRIHFPAQSFLSLRPRTVVPCSLVGSLAQHQFDTDRAPRPFFSVPEP